MKINCVQFNIQKNNKGVTINNKNTNPVQNNALRVDTFSHQVSFQGCTWYTKKVEQYLDAGRLSEIGEYFHKASSSDITNATSAHWFNKDLNKQLCTKLTNAVDNAKNSKSRILKDIEALELKKAEGLSNIGEQKTRMESEFVTPVLKEDEILKSGGKAPIADGIMIYGDSKENNNKFFDWLKKGTKANVETINYDSNKPNQIFKQIDEIMDASKEIFNATKKRTLLVINNLEELLSNESTQENRGQISAYKNRMDKMSENHVTVILKTSRSIDDLEEAVADRFKPVEITKGISPEEIKGLDENKAAIKRMNDRANCLDPEFCRHDDYSSYDSDKEEEERLAWRIYDSL